MNFLVCKRAYIPPQIIYTWLHHTHPDIPHLGNESFTWLRGALSTVDRPYGPFIDYLHHHIGSTHVLHHLNFKIPHYHAREATECLKPVLGSLYRYDDTPVWTALWTVPQTCQWVDGVKGVQFYKTIHPFHINRSFEQEPSRLNVDVMNMPTGHDEDLPTRTSAVNSTTFQQYDAVNSTTTTFSENSMNAAATESEKPVPTTSTTTTTQAKKELLIGEKIYDVSNLKHPGGRVIDFFVDTDATDAFAQFHHRSERAKKLLRVQPSRVPSSEQELEKFKNVGTSESSQALLEDFRKLEKELEAEGYFEPSFVHAIWRCLEIVLMHGIGLWMLARATTGALGPPDASGTTGGPGAALLGSSTWSWGGLSGAPLLDQWLFFPLGLLILGSAPRAASARWLAAARGQTLLVDVSPEHVLTMC